VEVNSLAAALGLQNSSVSHPQTSPVMESRDEFDDPDSTALMSCSFAWESVSARVD
jgi:hypothetical protein